MPAPSRPRATDTGTRRERDGPCLTGLETEAACPVSETRYDALDRKEIVIDPEGRQTKFVYDAAGEVLREIRAFGTALQQDYATWSYTPNGRQASVLDANGNRTDFFYDGFDRLARQQFPSASTAGVSNAADYEAFSYDAAGQVLTKRTRAGDVIAFAYDALGRVTLKSPGTDKAVETRYDLLGRVVRVAYADASYIIDQSYDGAGRLVSASESGPMVAGGVRTVSYQYDAASNRTAVTWPDGFYAAYAYDAQNRVTTVRENGTTLLATYSYDALARRVSLTLGNGRMVTYAYEPDGALDVLTHKGLVGGVDAVWRFDYNKANQIVARSTSDPRFLWTPSAAGSTGYTPNGLNQYSAVGSFTLAYDGNGSLVSDGVWSYGYDVENRLIAATGPGVAAVYAYDPLGRRASKSGTGIAATQFLSDGVEEIADYDGSGTLLRRYIHGPGIDEPLVMCDGTAGVCGGKQYYHADWQGSVVAMSSASGALLESYSYSAFGEVADASGNPFRYTGRRIDPETGLYYYRARYYAPKIGRFLQTDPVGYDAGLHLYAYVGNDPLNATDPTGECPSCIGAVIGAASELVIIAVEKSAGKKISAGEALARVAISAGAGAVGVGLGAKVGKALKLGKLAAKTLPAGNNGARVGSALAGGVRGAASGATAGSTSEVLSAEGKEAIGVGDGATLESVTTATVTGTVGGALSGVASGAAKAAASSGDVSSAAAKTVSNQAALTAEGAQALMDVKRTVKDCIKDEQC